ncbi:protein B4 [Pristis pectinata]|uniref:protein B4 n=1 Tax=Pristis pectinata TaxID=685728 RepID=UPI00223DAC39|nr:protein B4 [Pristis pectinata]
MPPKKAPTGPGKSGSQTTGVRVVPSRSQQMPLAGVSRRTSSTLIHLQYKRPPTIQMVVKALEKSNDPKGTSVPAIKSYILSAYPTVNPIILKYSLKKALSVGLEKGILIRPANSKATGATGRFKLAAKKTVKKANENSNPNVGPAKADVKLKAKTTGADKRSEVKKPKKSAELSKGKGAESGKASGKSQPAVAKKSSKKSSDKTSKPEGKKEVNKKLGEPSGTGRTDKVVKKRGGLSEALPNKALK